ncbi:MAG: hypothetical protein EHM70_15280 [Chloroflexota bacterium]|nr:MAG: hypothetical protein EHM70_15280 [Chloroflexota bacterium]
MKTHIIQLDPHDDFISVRDKIGWRQATRIVLVWPSHEPVLNRRLDLELLLRHSARQGTQMAIVTGDRDVRLIARQLKIPVFKTLRQAQSARWRGGRPRRIRLERNEPRPDYYALREQLRPPGPAWAASKGVRQGFYAISALVLLTLVAVFLPGAAITLTPKNQIQEITLTVSAGPNVTSATLSGDLPARYTSAVVEGRDAITTTGSILVPERSATGMVRFTNLSGDKVEVPAGTVVATTGQSSVKFETLEAGSMPAGVGETLLLRVRALSPGETGNLQPGKLAAIEGPLGLNLSVTNLLPTSGGSSLPVEAASPQDYDRLFERLESMLRRSAGDEIMAGLPSDSYLIVPSVETRRVIEKIYEPALPVEGENPPGKLLTLTLRLEVRALVVTGDDLRALSQNLLDATRPAGYIELPGSLVVNHLSEPALNEEQGQVYRWRLHLERLVQAQVDANQAAELAAGHTPYKATQDLLQVYALQSPPQISMAPSWWPLLPALPFRVRVDIRGQ